jgi:hypothetical protein
MLPLPPLLQSICTFKASPMLYRLLRFILPWSPPPIGGPGSFPNPPSDTTIFACRLVRAGVDMDIVIIAISKDPTSLQAHLVVWRGGSLPERSLGFGMGLCLLEC